MVRRRGHQGRHILVDRATAINNRGQIIGSNDYGPFLWDNGVTSDLPGLTSASDINDRGQILGLSDGRPVVWTYGMITPLTLPPGEWSVITTSINELGHAVGTLTSTAPGAVSMAVLWRDGKVIPLPGLAANDPTVANDLNNRDEIVGSSGVGFARKASLWVPQTPPTSGLLTSESASTDAIAAESPTATAQAMPIDLGTLGGTYSLPTGINDDGLVVGSSTTPAAEQHAFAWMPTTGMVDLGTLGDRSDPGSLLRTSVASAVSNTGEVVGGSYVPRLPSPTGGSHPDGYRAFLWTPSTGMQNLGTLAGSYSYAIAINDVGQVAGHSSGNASSFDRAALWTATGGWVDIGTLGGPRVSRWPSTILARSSAPAASSRATHRCSPNMRSCGPRAVAWWTLARWAVPRVRPRPRTTAARWSAGRRSPAPRSTSTGGPFCGRQRPGCGTSGRSAGRIAVARDVNEAGTVVGTSAVAAGNAAFHAFVWTPNDNMVDLGTVGGTNSEAYAVSDTGQVVGRSLTSGDAAWHAFAWTPTSGLVDLAPLPGYTDSSAYAVNNQWRGGRQQLRPRLRHLSRDDVDGAD